MQNLDIPIKDDNNDKLNFKPFAKKVAKGILNYKQSETLILSIEGKWGSGKTSLINLIENDAPPTQGYGVSFSINQTLIVHHIF